MSVTDTAVAPETIEVEVKVRPKRGRRFMQWMKDIAATARTNVSKGWTASKQWGRRMITRVQTAGTTAVNWIKRAASATGRGVKRLGHRIYWSGATVGRTLGRFARFLGRSARTFVRGTRRFLGTTVRFAGRTTARATGWTLRAVSWVFKTVLLTAFDLSLAAFLVTALIMGFFALVSDKYDSNVHRHAKAASVGEYRVSEPKETMREAAVQTAATVEKAMVPWRRKQAEAAAPAPAPRAGEGGTKVNPFSREALLDSWFDQKKDLPLPEDVSDSELTAFVLTMAGVHDDGDLGSGDERITIKETPRGMALSDNDYFQGVSYWRGRQLAHHAVKEIMTEVGLGLQWDITVADVRGRAHAVFVLLTKDLQGEFDARALHRPSLKKGYDQHTEYLLERMHRDWIAQEKQTAAEEKAAATAPAKKTTTRKAPAKKAMAGRR